LKSNYNIYCNNIQMAFLCSFTCLQLNPTEEPLYRTVSLSKLAGSVNKIPDEMTVTGV
jgi:hypothetical protein